jgi:hypothetical protein
MADDNYIEKFIQKEYGSIDNYRKDCIGDWDKEPLEEKDLGSLEISEIVFDEAAQISVEQLQRLLDKRKPRKWIQFDNNGEDSDDDASL